MKNRSENLWRILLIDDDEDDFLITRSMLNDAQGKKVELDWAPTYQAGEKLLQQGLLGENVYHAVLVDYDLGAVSGIQLIRETVQRGYPAPLILYTSRGSYAIDHEAMEAGATLYLTKAEASPLLLERLLRYAIERKRIEAERDRHLQARSDILESIQDGFISINRDWQITYINRRAAANNGFAPEDMVGRNLWEVFPKLTGTDTGAKYQQAMNERSLVQFETRGLYNAKWYNISVYPSTDGISIYWQDITARKQAEDELRESERKFSLIFDKAAFAAALSKLPDGALVDVNEAWVKLFGFSRQEALGKTTLELGINPDVEARKQILAQLNERGWVRDVEARLLTKVGDERILSINIDLVEISGDRYILNAAQDITERKRSEAELRVYSEALRESEEKYRDLFNNMNESMAIDEIIYDAEGKPVDWRILDVNPAYLRATHRARGEVVGRRLSEIYGAGAPDKFIERFARVVATGEPVLADEYFAPLGMNMFISAFPLGGKRFATLTTDITTRKQVDEAIRTNAERLQVMFDEHRAVMLLIEPISGAIVDANRAATAFYGYSREQLQEMRIDQINQLTANEVALKRQQAVDLVTNQFAFPHRLANGEVRWVEVYSSPVIVESRSMLFSIIHDITARREAEEELRRNTDALRESEEKFHGAFANAAIGFAMLTPDGSFVEANPAYCRLMRYSLEELKTMKLAQLIHPDDLAVNMDQIEQMLDGKMSDFVIENRYISKEGEAVWVRKSVSLVHGPDSAPRWIIALVENITERKRAEEALLTYMEQLRRSNQALEDFAFIASHDLQEPLRKVQAFGDLLKTRYSQALEEEGQDYIARMQQAGGRMEEMLNGLLAYSRINSQGKPFTQVDLGKVVKGVLSDLEIRLTQTGGQVEVASLPVIQADGLQIRQLFQNLIGNALKFHQPGVPPRVKISWRPAEENCIALIFEDNGIGFNIHKASYLFQPFHRLVGKSEYEGSGMGLAICQKIVERHGGRIQVDSQVGVGTRFEVILQT